MLFSLHKLEIDVLNGMQEDMLHTVPRERQVVLLSPTGSGKTLAYLLPLLQLLDAESDEGAALILVPSRELAQQTEAVARKLTPELRILACYGGRPAMDEHRLIRAQRPHIIVGTPGRVLDHIGKQNFEAERVRFLVIDEFDKCLELGFHEQMRAILGALRNVGRRILLSATDCPQIPDFMPMGNPCRLDYLDASSRTSDRIHLRVLHSPEKDKLRTLYDLLCMLGAESSMVFVNYRESVERVGEYLRRMDIPAALFHGGMEQRDRERALFRFSNGSANVLVTTDLASRGLDIADIGHIIHYHLPLNEEAFIHRNGRTARWDAEGDACLILGPEERVPEYIGAMPETLSLPRHLPSPAKPQWVTLYIGKGRKDKINKVDIVGFLSKVGGLRREELGRVDVLPGWAFAAVARRVAGDLLARVRGQKIKGIKTIFALAEE
ncbi:MAG: DEAD/DEAH box helicase [Bacteroidaceae bacterium]|nr:DEAD/DEAH box helicase [Bacteroidaceae bacterium]